MRVHDVTMFRAAGVLLDWEGIARRWLERQDVPQGKRILESVKGRRDVRLAWACSPDLGVPRGAFTVWTRENAGSGLSGARFATREVRDGQLVTWGGEEATDVRVGVAVLDPTRPVGLYLLRTGTRVRVAVAAVVVNPGGAGTLTLRAQAGAATHAVVVNGNATNVAITPVKDVIEDPAWKELEWVGLPVEDAGLRDYRGDKQGLVAAPVTPIEAAIERLERAGAPLGWQPLTETGVLAPPWSPPDPVGLVEETLTYLLPELPRLYSGGLREGDQHSVTDVRAVDSPSREDGTRVNQPATATTSPLHLLLLAAGVDPSTNLVTGFGTGYRAENLDRGAKGLDYLVTAPYKSTVLGDGIEVAAYVPPPMPHQELASVVDLRADRAALLPPAVVDKPFRESIEVSWRQALRHPTLTDPVAHAFAGWFAGDSTAVDLLPERPNGGPQPRALARPTGTTTPGSNRPKVVHPAVVLPIEGSVSRGYAVAQVDIFGLWSRWEDAGITTDAPSVLPPRVSALTLGATYAGSPLCASSVTCEFALDWTQRSPFAVQVRAVLYPMPTGTTPPPAGLVPGGPVPAGCHPLDVTLLFSGDLATSAGATIAPLRDDGSLAPTWGATEQGSEHRGYRAMLPGPALDFAAVSRWGVQVWMREAANGITTWSSWSPDAAHAATAMVASPVPALPVPPPLPPGVPLGSTPDAQGLSHARVSWSGLTSPQVDRVVIWEASETTLRQTLAPGNPADPGTLLGWRLQQLWDIYDAAPADRRPLAFRRAAEVPAVPASADIALPRGTEDIHAFLVTAVTTTGLESPWPDAGGGLSAHAHLQSVAAPRLRRPSAPLVRPAVQSDGSVVVTFETSAAITVTGFEVFATRSEVAARDHLTMGPPVTLVAAAAAFEVDGVTPRLDPITRQRVYTATWSGALPPSWEPWWLRATAIPVATVDAAAERGLVSIASDVVTLSVLPTAAPTLDPLVPQVQGADHKGLLIRTGTTALDRPVPAGAHRVTVDVGGVMAGPVALQDTALVADASTPPDTSAGPVVQRLARVAGRTPLLVWGHRNDPATAVQVTVRVVDPLARQAEETMLVPAWVEPVPELHLEIVDVFRIVGRGYVANLITSADPGKVPPYVLSVVATLPGRVGPILPPIRPDRPLPGPLRPLALRAKWNLPDIPARRSPVPPRAGDISAVRSSAPEGRTEIGLWVPLTSMAGLTVTIAHPSQGDVQQSWRPPR